MKKVLSGLGFGLALLASVFLVGCATVTTNVSAFHAMSAPAGMKYAMIPYKEQEGSLEYKTYAQAVSGQLQKAGMVEASVGTANIAVFIRYGIDNGREVVSSYPIIGQTGVASSNTYGTVSQFGNTSTLNATTYNTPTYGVVGSGSRSDTVYRRFLDLDIVEMSSLMAGAKVNKLYEGRARSEGSVNQLSAIMPYMIQSVFKEFPGESGKSRKVSFR